MIQIPTRFSKFEFTQAELYTATRFTDLQLALLQSLICDAALRKVALQYESNNPLQFAQREAELTSEIASYEWLLTLYTDTEAPLPAANNEKADVSKPSSQPVVQTQSSQGN